MPRLSSKAIFILSLSVPAISACTVKVKPDFDSSFPQDRFAAIVQARQTNDSSAVKPLIGQLASDDPLVRLAAVDTLRAITAQNHDFNPTADRQDRREGIKRWVDWFENGSTGNQPDQEQSP